MGFSLEEEVVPVVYPPDHDRLALGCHSSGKPLA